MASTAPEFDEDARQIVDGYDAAEHGSYEIMRFWIGLYGCNMAFRAGMIRHERFDENLALYGWQEDVDFSARISKYGQIVKTDAFVGVHRGVTG